MNTTLNPTVGGNHLALTTIKTHLGEPGLIEIAIPHDDGGGDLAEVAYHLQKRLYSVLAELSTFAKRAEVAWHADEPIGQLEYQLYSLHFRLEACLKSNQAG